MGTWYKVTLPASECGVSGKGKELQRSFEGLFIRGRATKDAALFTTHSDDSKTHYFYFSPGATAIARDLITLYGGVESPPPAGDVHLLVGHSGAREALLPKEERTQSPRYD
jgi:hypothetical protein